MRDPRGVDQLPYRLFGRQSLGFQYHGTLLVPTTPHRSRVKGHHGAADRMLSPVRRVLPLVMDYLVGVLAAAAVSAVSNCAIGSTSRRVPMLMEGKVNRTEPSIAFPWIVPVSVNVLPDSATVTDVDPVAAPRSR